MMTMTMTKTPASSDPRRDWRQRRPGPACLGAPRELFVSDDDIDPAYPPPEARAYCERCVLVPECLQEALDNGYEGVWGNTTKTQRERLQRKLNRAHCIGCGAGDSLVTEGNRQLCLSCGFSWLIF